MGVPETDDAILNIGGFEGRYIDNILTSREQWNLIDPVPPPEEYRGGCGDEIPRERQLSWIKWILQEADRFLKNNRDQRLFMTYWGYRPTHTGKYRIVYTSWLRYCAEEFVVDFPNIIS